AHGRYTVHVSQLRAMSLQLKLRFLALADVGATGDVSGVLPVDGEAGHSGAQHPTVGAVVSAQSAFDNEFASIRHASFERFRAPCDVADMHVRKPGLLERLCRFDVGVALPHSVHEGEASVGTSHPYQGWNRIRHSPQPALAFAEPQLSSTTVRSLQEQR